MRLVASISLFNMVALLVGCSSASVSFESRQLTFILDSLNSSKDIGPRHNWTYSWLGRDISLYAINLGDQILFANESGDFLRFAGGTLVEVRNILPGDPPIKISARGEHIEYALGDDIIATHSCNGWKLDQRNRVPERDEHIQQCWFGDGSYVNRYTTNRLNELTALEIVIHPHYPPLRLKAVREESE